jgi:hypothetical protein
MWKWLLTLLAFFFPARSATQPDYVGEIAAHAAYADLLPDATPEKPKVPTKDCTTCNGTGRVRSGDGHEWTKCPDCDGSTGGTGGSLEPPAAPGFKTPKSEPDRYIKPPTGTSLLK